MAWHKVPLQASECPPPFCVLHCQAVRSTTRINGDWGASSGGVMLHYGFIGTLAGCAGIGLFYFLGTGNPIAFLGFGGALLYLYQTRPRH